jgi:hypothetical protein
MPTYLVEGYMPRRQARDARAAGQRACIAAAELSDEGVAVRYVRTTFLPDDETCFHVFVADSAEAVEAVALHAKLGRARVVRAVETDQNASSFRAASTTRSGEGM